MSAVVGPIDRASVRGDKLNGLLDRELDTNSLDVR